MKTYVLTITSRVQQGLVFVGMNPEELLRAAESYQLNSDKFTSRTPYSVYQSAAGTSQSRSTTYPITDDDLSNYASPDFLIDHDNYSPSMMDPRNMRGVSETPTRPPESDTSDSEEDTTRAPAWLPAVPDLHDYSQTSIPEIPAGNLRRIATLHDLVHQLQSYRGSREEPYASLRRDLEEEIHTLYDPPPQPERTATEGDTAEDKDLIEPDANFFIPRPKSKITIKFDAPLYVILLSSILFH
jgi:hypothetical protein